jgi:hypothetical protein
MEVSRTRHARLAATIEPLYFQPSMCVKELSLND